MSKAEYMKRYGLYLKQASAQDRQQAQTDYGRNSKYYIVCASHPAERWSKQGTMKDLKEYVKDYNILPFQYVHPVNMSR